jgi:predicted DsbA family dithiol-disulfide isomerase
MQVEIWSDVICPWCGIGARRLSDAVARFEVEHGEDLQVVHHHFQLDPSAPVGASAPTAEVLAAKYHVGVDEARAMGARVEAIAHADGIETYRASDNRVGSTALVHELLAFAADRGIDGWPAAYDAYFGRADDIFTVEGLLVLAEEIGLDPDEARAVLADRRYRARVAADQAVANDLGATGVPFVVIDRKYAIPGAQSVEVFLQVLEKAWGARVPVVVNGDGQVCGPDGCAVPEQGASDG